MSTRNVCAALVTGTLLGGAVYAQTSREGAPQIWQQMSQRDRAEASGNAQGNELIVTLEGCLQREAEYRKLNDSGKGGALSTGAGLGNEYVLVSGGCGNPAGEAYELTGSAERDLEPYVGRTVQINGRMKDAKLEPTAGGGTRPTGGFDPLGQDLRLREVEVTSFAEAAAAPAQTARADVQREPAPVESTRQRQDDRADRSVGTAGDDTRDGDQLPRTASPLGAAGLVGLLAIGSAVGIRAVRGLSRVRFVRR